MPLGIVTDMSATPFSLEGLFDHATGDFTILTVCTGNICRSPLAEQYLRARLAGLPGLTVSSAGTMARDGDPMPAQAIAQARAWGAEPDDHGARYLVESQIAEADLVFGMAREHRRAVVSMHPRASRHTFTLREFARLAEGLTEADLGGVASLPRDDVPGRLRELVRLVASRRGTIEAPRDPDDDDVIDPYRQSDAVFERSSAQLMPAADVVVAVFELAATVTPHEAAPARRS